MVPRKVTRVMPPPADCPLGACLAIIGGAWTPNVIWYLRDGPRRFGDLRRDIGAVSARMLTVRLRRLESDGVVTRTVRDTSPPTVEYALTSLGLELVPAVEAIVDVGHRLKQLRGAARQSA